VELLTEFNFEQAQQFASEIEQYNSDRKDLDKQITSIPSDRRKQRTRAVHLCRISRELAQSYWCRIEINRNLLPPNTSVYKSGDKYAASARSVKGFDVYNALEACSNHLEQFWTYVCCRNDN
jgi:single-stranded-DNA-specific exonuclease